MTSGIGLRLICSLFSLLISTFDSFYQTLNTLQGTVKEALFIGGVMMVFLTYSVAGVILPSLTTKYVAKSMMVRRGTLCKQPEINYNIP